MAVHPVAAAHETLIRGFIKQGLSSRGIMRTLRGQGLRFRTADMLPSLRLFRGTFKFQYNIEKIAAGGFIPRIFTIEQVMKKGAAYRYFGEASFLNRDTGETYTKVVSWYSNFAEQKRLIEEEYLDDFPVDAYDPSIEMTGVSLTHVLHDPKFPY